MSPSSVTLCADYHTVNTTGAQSGFTAITPALCQETLPWVENSPQSVLAE